MPLFSSVLFGDGHHFQLSSINYQQKSSGIVKSMQQCAAKPEYHWIDA